VSRRSRGSLQLGADVAAGLDRADGDEVERIDPTLAERVRSAALLAGVVAVAGLTLASLVTGALLGLLYVAVRALSG
jgi:hypothetical protein